MIDELHRFDRDKIKILVNANDHRAVISKVGLPWQTYDYCFFGWDTSMQQARWAFLNRPTAEAYWPSADLVYCTSELYVPARRARLAVTAHDAACFERDAHRLTWSSMIYKLKRRYLFKKLSRRADRVVTVSHFSAERLGHFFPALKDRLCVVPNGVPWRFFDPVSLAGQATLNSMGLKGRRFIMVPGGLNYRKNADLVLRAWPLLLQNHPDLLLVVTSVCEKDYLKKASRLKPSVRLIGFVDDELLCSLYTAAAAIWFPSLYEGFGIPVLEAMACGTPVVTSTSSSLPEVAGDAAIMVSPKSVKDNVDALDNLLRSPGLGEYYAVAGRQRARQFTWAVAVTKLRSELQAIS